MLQLKISPIAIDSDFSEILFGFFNVNLMA
jgi:hypothetical protein